MMSIAITQPVSLKLSKNPDKLNITFFSLFVFICGLPSQYILNLMGELYVAELLLPILAVMLLLSGKTIPVLKQPIFWGFSLAWMSMMMGYIISDLVAGTSPSNYLRAWGRNVVLLSDFLALAILAGSDKRYLWWYILGTAIGSLIYLRINGTLLDNGTWKFGYGNATVMSVLAIGYFIPNLLSIGLLICIGIFSIYMDTRGLGSSCLILAGILWIRNANPEKLHISIKSLTTIFVAGAVVISIILIAMTQTGDEYSNRRGSSNTVRFEAIKIGIIAVSDSPLLGFGSWGEGTKKYAAMFHKETDRGLRQMGQSNILHSQSFMAHSQILQSWMEGGVLAAFFFLFFFYHLIKSLKYVVFDRPFGYLTLLITLILFSSAGNVIMSPYAGSHRLGIAMAIAIICILKIEKNRQSDDRI
ncbi:MAG: O-antigen ligase family protein [Methylobacter sp.]|nr:O-antigen ligase family protein [Methylobacter sp.]